VAIDSVITNKTGSAETVKQPLPLPQGVTNMAVGGNAQGQTRYQSPTTPGPVHAHEAPAKRMKVSSGGGGGGGGRATMGYGGGKAGADFGGALGGSVAQDESLSISQPVAPAPPPMAKPTVTVQPPPRNRPAADHERGERDDAKTEKTPPRLMISALQPNQLGDTRALVGAIEARLAQCSDHGEIKLRLTIDASGKVIKVDVLSGNGSCLQKKLMGLTTPTKPVGADTGTLEITLR